MLEGFEECMLREPCELLALGSLAERPASYVDPILARNPDTYAEFISDLWSRGMVGFTLSPRDTVGVFLYISNLVSCV